MDSLKFETYQFRDIPNCNLNSDFPIVGFNGIVDHNKFEGGLKIIGCTYDVENEEETEVEVGEIEFHAYNLSKLGFDYSCKDFKTADKGSKLYLAMDIDEPEFELYYSLCSRGYDKVVKPLNVEDLSDIFSTNADAYLITLDRFYIYEKYRKQGIATFIQKNYFKQIAVYYRFHKIIKIHICLLSRLVQQETLLHQSKHITFC